MDELATLDREAFAQVWSRVSAQGGGPVEVLPPASAQSPGEPQEQTGERAGDDAQGLQDLVLACLSDASAYRDLNRRTRRNVPELGELKNRKVHQARRLAAAYFLLSGVRYWPQEVTAVNPPEGFFPALRQRFLAEGRRAGELEALAGSAADPELRELYASLARETREMGRVIRLIVEREA